MSAITAATVLTPSALPSTLQDRFILTQVQSFTLVFPSMWVVEIFRIEKRQILDLPFYNPRLLGITHHNGRVLPLLDSHRLLTSEPIPLRETLTVIQLGETAGKLAQVGLIVDRALGSQARQALPPSLFKATSDPVASSSSPIVLLQPDLLDADLWHPLRWVSTPTAVPE